MAECNFLTNYHNNLIRNGAMSAPNLNYFSSDTESTQFNFKSTINTNNQSNFDKESTNIDFN